MGNLETDTVLKGRYQIKSVLGKNALGVTYEGTDIRSGSRIVVRELLSEGGCSRGQDSIEVVGNESFSGKKEQFILQMRLLAENKGLIGISSKTD